MTCTDYIIAQL